MSNKCEYCEELSETIDIEGKISVLFMSERFKSRYKMCEKCLNHLKKNGSLTSKDGNCTIILDK